jgi:MFS family permease
MLQSSSPSFRTRHLLGLPLPVAALIAVNFFMADVRDGLGPYLAAFLQLHGWTAADIGLALTLGGIVAMLATVPAGALVDAIRWKRAIMVAASLLVSGACLLLLWRTDLAVVGLAQIAMPLAGAVIPPAIAGISLGIVGPRGFDRQLGRNEAANHAGNVVAALLGGAAAWVTGIVGIFVVQIVLTIGAILTTLGIPPGAIDHDLARGKHAGNEAPAGFMAMLGRRPLLLFAATLACFHLGNAAMLPLVGLRLGAEGGSTGVWLSAAIIIAQLTMIPVAIATARVAAARGYRSLVIMALLVLPVRGLLAATMPPSWSILPVQVLDGIGAGLLGVATPGVVARLMEGSGRFNAGLGAVMTCQGLGAALSPTLGGWVAEKFGYGAAFGVLGAVAAVAVPVFLMVRVEPKPSAATGTVRPAVA